MKKRLLTGLLALLLLFALSAAALADHTHDYEAEIKLPSCTKEGYTMYICTICGDSYIGATYPALGHNWDDGTVTREPGCTEAGEQTFACKRCKETRTDSIPAAGHKWDPGTVTKAPTCAESGVQTLTCTVCGETKTQTLAATGKHTYQNGICTVCGAKDPGASGTPDRPDDGGKDAPPAGICPSAVFQDVSRHDDTAHPDHVYHAAIDWAVTEKITDGTTDTTFSPHDGCTRAQAVTFLWRAAKCPEPKNSENPFRDVADDAYYYDAVLWAVENKITDGTSDTTFSPDDTCTRAHIVTFLYRALKGTPVSGNAFADVPAGMWFSDAVSWAVSKGITDGVDEGVFAPDATCERAHIVTFLWRAMDT